MAPPPPPHLPTTAEQSPVQPQPLANPHLGCINEIDQGNEADPEEASSASGHSAPATSKLPRSRR